MSLAIYQQLVVGLKVVVNNPSKQITACKREWAHINDADATFCKVCGSKIVEQKSYLLEEIGNIFNEIENDALHGDFVDIEIVGHNDKIIDAIFINDDKTEIFVRLFDNHLIENRNIFYDSNLQIKTFDKNTIERKFILLEPIAESLKKLDFILSVEPMLFNINAISA